jgi:bacteriorhodopsin
LRLELYVQTIELIFYIWMVRNITKVKNITLFRYIDWMFTTPLMLITLIIFLDHDPSITSLKEYFIRNKDLIKKVIALNAAMLGAGFLGEYGTISTKTGAVIGILPFLTYFKAIWDKLVKGKKLAPEKVQTFLWFFVFWSLYGVAALAPYEVKNAGYNILDLFAKNFFGVFLTYLVWKNRV